jgi:hypothetical protein
MGLAGEGEGDGEGQTENGSPIPIMEDSPVAEDATTEGQDGEGAAPRGIDASNSVGEEGEDEVDAEDVEDEGENCGGKNTIVNASDFDFGFTGATASKVAKPANSKNSVTGIPVDFLA